MNAGGSAIVSAFDAGTAAFNCTMSALSPGERTKLGTRIKTCETKIRALHVEIAKETAKYPDPAAALESETVKAILTAIKELDTQIELMRQHIAELDKLKAGKKPQQESAGVAHFIVQSLSGLLPGEKASIQHKIHANDKKIQELYCEFAKEAAKQPDLQAAINSEVVVGIFAKINELKAENDYLKLGNTGLSEKKAERPKPEEMSKPAEKKPQPESSGVAKFFMHALSDTLSGYLPTKKNTVETADVNNPGRVQSKEPAPESAEVSVPENNEQADVTVIGYDRTKACQILTPTMQPPTREDIENITREIQADGRQGGHVSMIVEEHADEMESAPDAKDFSPVDSAENLDVHVTSEDFSYSDELANSAMEEPVPAAVHDEAIDITEESEREMVSIPGNINAVPEDVETGNATSSQEELDTSTDLVVEFSPADMAEPLSEILVVEASPIVAAVPDETIVTAEESENEAASLEHSNFVKEEADPQNHIQGIIETPMNGFESTRTRNQVTSFAVVAEYTPSPAPIAHEAAFRDGSGPVFRTRSHQNSVSTVARTSEPNLTDADAGLYKETSTVKMYAPPQQNAMPALTTESEPIFRAKLHQPIALVVKALSELSPKENIHKIIKASVDKKTVSAQKQVRGNTTSPQKKSSSGIVGNKKNVLPKGKEDSFKTGKSLPKKRT
jgi:hypothetical protein